ncbi:MAG: ABC transporter ATP-binding protein [Pyrinomonadaceae bacterium]
MKKFLHLAIKPSIEALRDVSFDIREGEIFGLIGRNGAGKTTLTKIIATLVQPSGGQVFVEGFDTVADEVKVRSMIGLATAEERSFYWRLTSLQNLMFFARLYGIKDEAARQRIVELFEQLDLNDLTDRNFSELSTGNKQRLAVARALIPNPPILLLDEPTRSLDPLAAGKMRELILSLKGISILLTSHNLNEVEELCNRVAIISGGEIRAVETPEKLRLFHKQTQTVKINFTNPCEKELKPILADYLEDFTIESKKDFLELEFSREASDDLLGKTVSLLNENGAKILDITTEKATLLDVLESYE